MELADRVCEGPCRALVTGAGARLGKAMAMALGDDGWNVAVHYNKSRDGAETVAEYIRKTGSTATAIQADLSHENQTKTLIKKANEALGGPLTLLVNSASIFRDDTARDHTRQGWQAHMTTNLRAPVLLARQVARALPHTQAGLIINIIDMRVLKLNPLFFTYTLSKSALWTATQTLAQAFAPNIRVNAIGPGPTLANIYQKPGEFAAESRATLTGKGSSPDEIVAALRYLIAADSVTGQMITSDGGQHLMWQTPDVIT